jgi:hypothetical protein
MFIRRYFSIRRIASRRHRSYGRRFLYNNKNKRERRKRKEGERVLSVESGTVKSGKAMMSDNSWVRTKYDARTKPELLLMKNNIENEILPRFDKSDSSNRIEMMVRPTFRTHFPTK